MVCELPEELRRIVDRHKECSRTSSVTGESRTVKKYQGVWSSYYKDCTDALEESMKQAQARLLGKGAHRVVFGYHKGQGVNREDCVVKVALSGDQHSITANKSEATSYKRLPEKVKQLFIPVQRSDPEGWWVTQPKSEKTGEDVDYSAADRTADRLHDEIRKAGLKCIDIHPANIGRWKGRWRVLDYGFGVEGCPLTPVPKPQRPSGQRSLLGFRKRVGP